jgi:hypothetical protein
MVKMPRGVRNAEKACRGVYDSNAGTSEYGNVLEWASSIRRRAAQNAA